MLRKQSEWVRAYLEALVSDDCWVITRLDSGNMPMESAPSIPVAAAVALFTELEEMVVAVRHPQWGQSWMQFIWQGPDADPRCGEEVLSDYGMRLDPWLTPVMRLAE